TTRSASPSSAASRASMRASCSTRSITCAAFSIRCGSATCGISVSTKHSSPARGSRTTDLAGCPGGERPIRRASRRPGSAGARGRADTPLCRRRLPEALMATSSTLALPLRETSLFREQAFIAGQWESADDGRTKSVFDPATGRVIGSVPNLGALETPRAIAGAERALPDWRARTAQERARILRAWFELLMAHQEDLATLMTLEQGKPLVESRAEIAYAASFIEWFGEEARRAYGD